MSDGWWRRVEGVVVAAGDVGDDEVHAGVAVEAVDLGFHDEIEFGADGELGFKVAHFEGDAAGDARAAGDGELEVGAGGADAARGRGEADVLDEEAWRGVAAAEGFEFFEVSDDVGAAVVEGKDAVESHGGGEEVVREFFVGEGVEAVAEGVEVGEGEFDAAGHGVAAAGGEEVASVFDGEVELEAGDGAGGAVQFNFRLGEDEGGAVVEVDDAGGDDADDAGVEGGVGDDENGIYIFDFRFSIFDLVFGDLQHFLFGGLPFAVLGFEVLGDFFGAFWGRRGQEFDGFSGVTHAAGGVQARGESEADGGTIDLFPLAVVVLAVAGGFDEGEDAGVLGAEKLGEAVADDDAVFAG